VRTKVATTGGFKTEKNSSLGAYDLTSVTPTSVLISGGTATVSLALKSFEWSPAAP
jgi:hypothetical protein